MFNCEQDSFWILEENQQDIMSQVKQVLNVLSM